ncbi:MerR family transcriptional regulator [Actinosynnema pretiosum]|uniref:MerR family transcriptional regulator n=1 Tax=Actinosynnema pretiosum TaxID=42197 RepID=A0A290YZD9_9PSEU|nr:MerR family transcriptional regulator [Actinosynnema pretiosum]ATE52099.1 MerR family transcriptional regulator [Actinosynnema pretiosum]
MTSELVPTGVAAKALGVDRATLVRWWQQGLVTPTLVTAGGHGRWDLDELREQLRALRRRDE